MVFLVSLVFLGRRVPLCRRVPWISWFSWFAFTFFYISFYIFYYYFHFQLGGMALEGHVESIFTERALERHVESTSKSTAGQPQRDRRVAEEGPCATCRTGSPSLAARTDRRHPRALPHHPAHRRARPRSSLLPTQAYNHARPHPPASLEPWIALEVRRGGGGRWEGGVRGGVEWLWSGVEPSRSLLGPDPRPTYTNRDLWARGAHENTLGNVQMRRRTRTLDLAVGLSVQGTLLGEG